jgi:hypothetical protein
MDTVDLPVRISALDVRSGDVRKVRLPKTPANFIGASLSFASGGRKPAARLAKIEELEITVSDAIDRWTVGNVTITRVVEFEIGGFPVTIRSQE